MIVLLGFLAGVAAVVIALLWMTTLPLFDRWLGDYGPLVWLAISVGLVGAFLAWAGS